jgi:hypothetical protein
MANPSIDIAVGSQGFKFHAASTVTGVSYDAIVVHEDTVFTSFSVQSDNASSGTNVLSARGLSGVTVKAGTYLPAGKAQKIVGFVTSSGTVIGY